MKNLQTIIRLILTVLLLIAVYNGSKVALVGILALICLYIEINTYYWRKLLTPQG